MKDQDYTIFDATTDVITKVVKFIGKLFYRFIKWAFYEF